MKCRHIKKTKRIQNILINGILKFFNRVFIIANQMPTDLSLEWENNILPLFETGRVEAVFSGDGGVSAPGSVKFLKGIPHYLSGWSFDRIDIPPEWLRIDLKDEGIEVSWQKLLNGQLFIKRQETP